MSCIYDHTLLAVYIDSCSLITIFSMDEDRERFIVSKKSNKIDEDSRKKGKKNRRKDHSESSQDPPSYNVSLLKNPPPNNNAPPVNNSHNARRKDQEQVFRDLCQIFSTYRPATIRSMLEDHNYNKAQATNALCEIPPDNQEEEPMLEPERLGKNKSEDNSSTNNSEVAQTIINEVYDNLLKEEINGREFQELFEEIAEMIKEDQRDRGFGMLEINSFVDECRSIEQTLLVGFREELSSFDDYEFDQSYPLYAQTQEYILEATLKQAKQEKKQKEDFPTLGSTSTARKGGGLSQQRNIIDRISQDQRRRVQQETAFFAPRKNVPSYAKERINQASIFNVDNKLRSERDLMSLHKQFLNMPIRDLKFVYVAFIGDYNISREFLIKYYGNTRQNRTEATTSSWRPQAAVIREHSRLRKEEMDEQLKHLSLKEIRDELDHLFKLRQTLQMTKAKIPSASKKQDIDRLINQKTPLIRKLAQAARLKEVEQMIRGNPLYVDLHGYREEEIEPLLETIRDMLREQFDRHNERVRTKKVKGRLVACLTVMTGKGIHSRHNRSVLKPATIDWCNARGFDYEEADDHVLAFIVVS